MAHYALLDENNLVVSVITGIDENELIEGKSPEVWYGEFHGMTCVRTSYHGNIRKNYAGVGYSYDSERDAFIAPKPYPSWVLDENTCKWKAPLDYPSDGDTKSYRWNEMSGQWEFVANIIQSEDEL